MALVRSDQKGMEEVQRIRAALAESRPVITEAKKDLIEQQMALLGEDGDAIIRGIQEEAKLAGPSSRHLQSHREMLSGVGPESGAPGKVERSAEGERAAEVVTSRGYNRASNQVCWCKRKGG